MIYVLSKSKDHTEAWRQSVGFPHSHVTHIGSHNTVRGRRMEAHEVIMLESFEQRPKKDKEAIKDAIAPCGVIWELIPVLLPIR